MRLNLVWILALVLTACAVPPPPPPPPREPTGGGHTRFCAAGEYEKCRAWTADQNAGTVGRGYQDE